MLIPLSAFPHLQVYTTNLGNSKKQRITKIKLSIFCKKYIAAYLGAVDRGQSIH